MATTIPATDTSGPLVEAREVRKTYRMGAATVDALRGADLRIDAGERLFIGGPSGSGKSTLLHILGCLDKPTSGTVKIFGGDIATLDDDTLSRFRARHIGFIFQSYNLIPVLSVRDNVEYPLLLCRTPDRADRVKRVLEMVGLQSHAGRFPNELSGGQCQRVAIARALVTDAKLLIADEPTANLDSENHQRIIDLMFELSEREGRTLVVCTHNDSLLSGGRGRTVILKDGQILSDTPRSEP